MNLSMDQLNINILYNLYNKQFIFFNRYAKMTGKSAILAKNGINMPPYQKDA